MISADPRRKTHIVQNLYRNVQNLYFPFAWELAARNTSVTGDLSDRSFFLTCSNPQAEFEQLCSDASRAVEAGDYATAERLAVAAQIKMASLPTMSSKSGFGGTSLSFTPTTLAEFIASVRRMKNEASIAALTSGISIMPLQFRSARCSVGYP